VPGPADDEADENRPGIQSVEIAARILLQLVEYSAPVQLRELAKAVGMPPNKVHRYLVSLTRTGLMSQDEGSGRYGLGPASISLGLAGLRMTDAIRQAFDALPRLRDVTNETAVIGVWTPHGPVITRIEESSRPVFMNVRVGSILPLTRTAVGQIYAAFIDSPHTRTLLRSELHHQNALFTPTAFAQTCASIRRRRFSAIQGLLVPGVAALAAPVLDHRGRIALSIGLLGRVEDLSIEVESASARELIRVATELSESLGFDQSILTTPPRDQI